MAGTNLVNADRISKSWGTRTVLSEVSLGLSTGDVIGVVGRNGDGKTTLLALLTGALEPDSGAVTRTNGISIGVLAQAEAPKDDQTVRDLVVGGRPDHVWAADREARSIVEDMLSDVDLDRPMMELSGGERRRAALVAIMLGDHDLLVLDEPTNHLDVEAVAWLAGHLRHLQERGVAMLVVSHDRWFLDEICTHIWEVHDATVESYEGGYSAYTLARVERTRIAASNEAKRQNLARKELAWLRRGAPARSSKPRYRVEAANALIADVPEPRDKLELARFSATRLGKDVLDLKDVTITVASEELGERTLLDKVTWSIGPGDRIGLVGVNGAGKTTLLNLFDGSRKPDSGRVKRGKTLRLAHLRQEVDDLDTTMTVLESVNDVKARTKLATGRDASAADLLEGFGFTGQKLVTRIADLSGGERRRLQLLRLLMDEPNVLLLDEPTNDLDIDTLRLLEDYLDSWPGTLIVVSHDRWFLERVCDVVWALMGDGTVALLPGGISQYLEQRRNRDTGPSKSRRVGATSSRQKTNAAALRRARKDMDRIDRQMGKVRDDLAALHEEMAVKADDYQALTDLQIKANDLDERMSDLEEQWLEAADIVENQ
ncbi:ABC-F family ATP-binding cassette domain-containing protein [Cutibacterium sp.]|uniref:ABC-F family ATP-binding cassette domain-containing protein n=1 Tax=Cutibacterium sp. TaxID=1912221 RepID=UPI0026DD9199|nr:ABC-F family ATP-binding cassette domain-containing protein [Cutibacterium sp.]MDO4411576.1 ABC-F family ATP-binding cassette domain-containing protein [Cutibacterium sp.]